MIHHRLYATKEWRQRSRKQLRDHPLCVMCADQGWVTPATVADHIKPHKGNADEFYHGALQSLCAHHHNKTKKQLEIKGFTTDIGLDGWPSDPRHPSNRLK